MKRAKYRAKNIHEYKRLRTCTHYTGCKEYGIVSYRNDTEEGTVRVEYRCIPHVHDERPEKVAKQASDENFYRTMTDVASWLSLAQYATGKGR